MLIIDTLQTSRRFQNAGMSPEQADVLTETFRETQEQSIENLVTKGDIERLETKLETKIEHDFSLVRKDLEATEFRLSAEIKLLRWMMGFLLAGVAALILKAFFGA